MAATGHICTGLKGFQLNMAAPEAQTNGFVYSTLPLQASQEAK